MMIRNHHKKKDPIESKIIASPPSTSSSSSSSCTSIYSSSSSYWSGTKNQEARLTISGDPTPLKLTQLKILATITGFLAETVFIMTFKNPHSRQLEGELNFPLPSDAVVNGFGMDINGAIVDAVPVEKETARVAFEQQVRQGKSAGLVEAVKGNSFKNRIYPIPANGTKTVKVSYLSETEKSGDRNFFGVPLNFKDNIDDFYLRIEVNQSPEPPKVEESDVAELSFEGGDKKKKFTTICFGSD